ncbi:MAG TPA: lysylphosphatidylglycerol synthase transmembrane domain-containing protein [Bacteroidota bacterium]|nr:lysylphosphatidylglycerol synthase transmembrane domain-containing protein [Bacteroidota bacterium]
MKKIVQYAVSILLTLGFLYFAFRGTDFGKLLDLMAKANYWWALAGLPPLLVSHMFRTWRWYYLLRPVKEKMRFRNLWSALCVGYMLNNVLPKVGEIVRPLAIGKLEGVSRSAAFGTLIVERIFDVLSFLIMVALLPLIYSGPLLQVFPWLQTTGIWISAVTIGALAVCVILMLRRDLVVTLLGFLTKHLSAKRAESVSRIAHSFLDGFLFLKRPRHFAAIFLLSILVWGLYFVMMYLPFYAFGLTEQYGLDFRASIVVQTISSLAYMAPTPGATGSYHYFTMEALTKLYGVDTEMARSYATVTHAVGFIGITLIGLYYFWADKLHLAEFTSGEQSSGAQESQP